MKYGGGSCYAPAALHVHAPGLMQLLVSVLLRVPKFVPVVLYELSAFVFTAADFT